MKNFEKVAKFISAYEVPMYMRHPENLRAHIKEQEIALKEDENSLEETKKFLELLKSNKDVSSILSWLTNSDEKMTDSQRQQAIKSAEGGINGLKAVIENKKKGLDKYYEVLKDMEAVIKALNRTR